MHATRRTLWAFAAYALSSVCSLALADASQETCLDLHGRAQDAHQRGQISIARGMFMACAQAGCPPLVQADCARYADDLQRIQPSLTFVARDSSGNDLPDTAVYVDEQLAFARLNEGRPHEVDPGKHVIRFKHGSREYVTTLVVGSGEKSRIVVGTFASTPRADDESKPAGRVPAEQGRKHALGASIMVGASAATLAAGGALVIAGFLGVPEECSVSTHRCAAPPGDDAFEQAAHAVRLSNIGWVVAGAGAAALTAGLVWYAKSARRPDSERRPRVAPFATRDGGGISINGHL